MGLYLKFQVTHQAKMSMPDLHEPEQKCKRYRRFPE